MKRYETPRETKVAASIREALEQCGAKSGMTFSFHHHLRDGDYVMNQVMEAAVAMGLRDLTIAASSTGSAHDPIAQYIKDGIVVGLQTSGIRGKMGEVVSQGYLKTPAILRSHGGHKGDVNMHLPGLNGAGTAAVAAQDSGGLKVDRKSTRLNSSHWS